MRPAQRFANQPADIVELLIVRGEQAVGAHRVEGIEKAAQPFGIADCRPAGLPGAGEALGGGVELLLDRVGEGLRRTLRGLGLGLGATQPDHLTSSAQRRPGEVQYELWGTGAMNCGVRVMHTRTSAGGRPCPRLRSSRWSADARTALSRSTSAFFGLRRVGTDVVMDSLLQVWRWTGGHGAATKCSCYVHIAKNETRSQFFACRFSEK
jgi:hypothetical protein